MAQVIKEIQLEVSKPNFIQAIVAKQFDSKSRWLRVQLVDNGEKITVADTSAVTINARRSDGGEKKFAGSVDKGKGTVLVPLSAWMLQLEGTVKSDVSVTDTSGRILTTTNFTIEVERASCQDSGVSEDDANIDILTQLILDVQSIKPDTTYNPESTNAQSGKAVAEALANVEIDVDNAMSITSENPVQNKVAKAYVDSNVLSIDANVQEVSNILDKSINLYNKKTITATGGGTNYATDYILLKAGTYYVTGFVIGNSLEQKFTYYEKYDINKNFIKKVTFTTGELVIDEICYIKFTGTNSRMKYIVLSKDAPVTEYVEFYTHIKPEYFPTVEQTYNETSENAQSGIAVAQALKTVKITTDTTIKKGSANPVSGGAVYESFKYRFSLPILIPPNSKDSFPKISTVDKTLTFVNDTVLINDRLKNGWISLKESSGNNSVTWGSEITSSIISFYYDIENNKIIARNYTDYDLTNDLILLFVIRNGSVSKQVWSPVPIYINGKLSTDISSAGGNESTDEEKEEVYENDNVKSVNHRGYNTEAPENTLSAYKLSKQKGFKYVECDVQFTADGVPVLLHDTTIDRTSDGTGNLAELTYDYVRSLDFGSWKSSTYAGEKIPHFEEFIVLCRNLGLHPYIEPKMSLTNEQVETVFNIVKSAGMKNKVTWISFSPTHLGIIKELNPNARLGYVVENISSTVITKALDLKTDTNEVFIDVGVSGLTNETVEMCINADIPLETWTVNTEDAIKSLHSYVSGVTSDKLMAGRILIDANIK